MSEPTKPEPPQAQPSSPYANMGKAIVSWDETGEMRRRGYGRQFTKDEVIGLIVGTLILSLIIGGGIGCGFLISRKPLHHPLGGVFGTLFLSFLFSLIGVYRVVEVRLYATCLTQRDVGSRRYAGSYCFYKDMKW